MISAVVLTKNNQDTLYKTLESLISFSEVILIDTGSEDNTISIAKGFSNVTVFEKKLVGFGKLRNQGAALAKNDWILALDSDEILSSELISQITKERLDKKFVYSFPFHNFLEGRRVTFCGWHPESHIRLYNRKETAFNEDLVHEGIKKEGLSVKHLKFPIIHTPYRETKDFLHKMQLYTDLFAKQNQGKKKANLFIALIHSFFAFFKSYFLKKGIFHGRRGFLLSIYQANTALYKYLKLEEKNKSC